MLLIELAPRPGLEPGICGLIVRRSEAQFYCFINCLQRARNLTVAFECSATRGRNTVQLHFRMTPEERAGSIA